MDELLKKYSIDEIAKKTSISPSVLEKLVNKEFDKIDEFRVKGFLKILKEEFNDIDFSELEEKANSYYFQSNDSKKTEKRQIVEELDKDNKSNYKNYLFVITLIIVIGILLYYMNNKNKIKSENNHTNLEIPKIKKIAEKNETNLTNLTKNKFNFAKKDKNETNLTTEINSSTNLKNNETNLTTIKRNISKKIVDKTLKIEPLKLVWFKVYYLNSNKSKEFYTSNSIDLNGSQNLFIKFGHGMEKLYYNGKTIFPNKQRVVRIILKDGELNLTKKRLKSFK